MKIAITTGGFDMDAPVERRFGRASGFLVVDTATGVTQYLDNREEGAAGQRAGIRVYTGVTGGWKGNPDGTPGGTVR
jgi:predicted Fe-Mo cluster-binding NifX family protein